MRRLDPGTLAKQASCTLPGTQSSRTLLPLLDFLCPALPVSSGNALQFSSSSRCTDQPVEDVPRQQATAEHHEPQASTSTSPSTSGDVRTSTTEAPASARRRNAVPGPQRRRRPFMDSISDNPRHTLQRLAIPDHQATTFALEEALKEAPILRPRKEVHAMVEANEAARRIHNTAVRAVMTGVHAGDWEKAYSRGWKVLFARESSHLQLDMATTEALVRLLSQQQPAVIQTVWPEAVESLLIPTLVREIEIGNMHASVVAQWMYSEIRHHGERGRSRVLDFWTAFIDHARKQELGRIRGDPFHLLQIPTNVFCAALAAHYQAGIGLKAFITSFYEAIAVPSGFVADAAYHKICSAIHLHPHPGVERQAAGSGIGHSADGSRLSGWAKQMLLLRIWARRGTDSIYAGCTKWSERMHQQAAIQTWQSLSLAVSEEIEEDRWLEVDWRSAQDRRDSNARERQNLAISDLAPIENPPEELDSADKDGRPKLPAVFTPEIAARFLRTFLHVGAPEHAEAAWNYIESRNLRPDLVMWNALLFGHAQRKDLEAARSVFSEMEQTPDAKPDAVAWSVLITAYFRAGQVDAGIQAVQSMMEQRQKRNLKMTAQVYNGLINSLFWNSHSAEMALELLQQMQDEKINPDVFTANILLRYYSRKRTFELEGVSKALQLLTDYQITPDVYTLSMLLDALILAGRFDAVDKLHEIMKALKVKPNTATYGAMINHLVKDAIKSGEKTSLHSALRILRVMQDSEAARPTEITYSSLVQGFSRFAVGWNANEELQIAEDLHDEMLHLGVPPNRITYNSLMAAYLAKSQIPKALHYFNKYRQMKDKRSASADVEESDLAESARSMSRNVPMRTWQALVTGLVDKKQYGIARSIIAEMQELGLEIRSPAFQKVVRTVAST